MGFAWQETGLHEGQMQIRGVIVVEEKKVVP